MKKNFDKLIRVALLAPFVAAMVIHGSTKPAPVVGTITYLRTEADVQYLYDAGSFVSNDLVHVAFTFAVAPGTADFQLWAWPRSSTNEEEMVLVYSNSLAGVAQPYEFEYAGAISNRWFGFTTWTPGPSVHTNGVALVNWQLPYDPAATNIAAMTRTGVYFNGKRLAPNVIALPYDAELEYLESSGTQWIDTGVIFSSNSGWDVTFTPLQNPTYNLWVMGTQNASGSVYGIRITSSAELQAQYGPTRVIVAGSNVGVRYSCVLDSTSLTLNDSSVIRSGDPGDFTRTILLFAWQWRTGGSAGCSHCRIYAAKLYDNQVIVRDLIPVRDWDGNAKMFDRVTGTYPAHYGTFVGGPDK